MTRVRVDAASRTAWIEAGARWQQVVQETARHGLAPLNGSAPDVGAVSYTLGGGLPLLARTYGAATDHVRSVDIVTADGRLRHVRADSDPDLFWALRGAAPNFGVVTSIEMGLVDVDRLYGGGMYFDARLVPNVLDEYARWATSVPWEMNSSVSVLTYPDIPQVREAIRGRYVAHLRIAYTGTAAVGDRLIEPLRAIGPRLIDTVAEMPYTQCGAIYADPPVPHAYYGSNVMLSELDPEALRAAAIQAGPSAPVMCVLDVRHLGGRWNSPPSPAAANSYREANYVFRVLSPFSGTDIVPVRSLHHELYEEFASWKLGRSLNFIYGADAQDDHVREAFKQDVYERLAALKARYDPGNIFRLNYNIKPSGA
jgi:hypothetical protein